ncbi:hypothetical protein [Nostoc sp. JL23]|uniref:hypothetical protein n=1 Tax=Nostoc sp. JL23 TaxID=2815394 RepID=UPI001D38DAF5|nr:hypothetical protein [Nostoc sp. JL23]MBN3875200.1 hypothetical protein [Nostoc sp. JL23]
MYSEELELAKIGYRAYGETTDFKNYQGLPMPKWEDLPEKIQIAWMAAAVAIAKKTVKEMSESLARTIVDDVVEILDK